MWLRSMVSLLSLVVQLQKSEDILHSSSVFTSESPARASTKHTQRLSMVFATQKEADLARVLYVCAAKQESCDLVYARMPTQIRSHFVNVYVHLEMGVWMSLPPYLGFLAHFSKGHTIRVSVTALWLQRQFCRKFSSPTCKINSLSRAQKGRQMCKIPTHCSYVYTSGQSEQFNGQYLL